MFKFSARWAAVHFSLVPCGGLPHFLPITWWITLVPHSLGTWKRHLRAMCDQLVWLLKPSQKAWTTLLESEKKWGDFESANREEQSRKNLDTATEWDAHNWECSRLAEATCNHMHRMHSSKPTWSNLCFSSIHCGVPWCSIASRQREKPNKRNNNIAFCSVIFSVSNDWLADALCKYLFSTMSLTWMLVVILVSRWTETLYLGTLRPFQMFRCSSFFFSLFVVVCARKHACGHKKNNIKQKHELGACVRFFFYPVLQSFRWRGALMQSDKLLSGLIQATGRARQN